MRYKDQNGYEIYDWYDLESKEPVPAMIDDAEIISSNDNSTKFRIDYPVINCFTLASTYDGVIVTEQARKAFVRGGYYKHPIKRYLIELTTMDPTTYLARAHSLLKSRGSKLSFEELIAFKMDGYDLDTKIAPYKGQMFYPYLNYKDQNQEGIHRALWAIKEGYNEIPVIIIK